MDASRDDGGKCSSGLIRQFSKEIIDETGAIITFLMDKEKLVEQLQNNHNVHYKERRNKYHRNCVVIGCNKFAKNILCPIHMYIYRDFFLFDLHTKGFIAKTRYSS